MAFWVEKGSGGGLFLTSPCSSREAGTSGPERSYLACRGWGGRRLYFCDFRAMGRARSYLIWGGWGWRKAGAAGSGRSVNIVEYIVLFLCCIVSYLDSMKYGLIRGRMKNRYLGIDGHRDGGGSRGLDGKRREARLKMSVSRMKKIVPAHTLLGPQRTFARKSE